MFKSLALLILCLMVLPKFAVTTAAAEPAIFTFEEHVRPIFKAHCFHCHGEDHELSGGLDLRLVRLMKTGGDSGAAIVPKDRRASLLWQRIEADEMPEGSKKLTPEQKMVVRRWIEQGATTARPEPANVEDARFSVEDLSHWAYQPVMKPTLPSPTGYELRTPIDSFIAERLREHNLSFSRQADPATLVRRATFDLSGLPPTSDEVEAFVADDAPDAYARLIDRLLASPQFGVRWGRHWLDVAGFAETNGGPKNDTQRPQAWRYRDYVIDAFNSSKPVDKFYVEQLAGDEMITGELDALNTRQLELLTATGFLRMAPDPTHGSNTLADRNRAVADAVKVISSSMLGVTIGCAQCHDHKYDPIGIDDYYRFRAIFDPVFPLQDWQQPNSRLVDFTTDGVRAEADRIEAQAKTQEGNLNARRNALGEKILEQKLAAVPEKDRDAAHAAVLAQSAKRTKEQQALLDLYPMVKPVRNIVGLLVEYDKLSYRKFEKEQAEIARLRATKPPLRMVMATRERPGVIPASAVFLRGNPESPGDSVQPGELMVLTRHERDVKIPENDEALPSTGRRLAYAKQLTDGAHPLTARVFVNRIWLHHTGRGLVATPSDFGISGEEPSHPKLLDWLADDLVRHDWDQKRLHRMIMLSTTYQQTAKRTPQLDDVDPENEFLGRMNVRRLEAEAMRDAILFVAGRLNDELGGPSVPVTENPEGKVVIGRREIRDGLRAGVDGNNADAFRRSAFIEVSRRLPLNVLATFDQPEMNPNCDLRRPSTVAAQSLWFLNDTMLVQRAEDLAHVLLEMEISNDARLDELFVRLFAVPPTQEEKQACREFLGIQMEYFRTNSSKKKNAGREIEMRAMAALCQTLLASNRFLYVD